MSKLLADFVLGEIDSRRVSLREFADMVGVSHSTLSRLINKPDSPISFELLTKLAAATKTDIGIIARLAAPHVAVGGVDIERLASRISRLPADKRRVVDMVIAGAFFERSDKSGEQG